MNPKILLIEDEEYIRDLYKRQLELAGFPTDAMPDGTQGLEASVKATYSLFLLDIMLPDKNGLEVLKELKANSLTKDVPVILLTNLGQDEIIKQGFALGAEGYLVKAAYTPDQIIDEVKKIIQKEQDKAYLNS